VDIQQTEQFATWLARLDDDVVAAISERLFRLANGLFGHTNSVGAGVMELKIDIGKGWRVYYIRHGPQIVILLCGGNKSTQNKDISKAHDLARMWREQHKQQKDDK